MRLSSPHKSPNINGMLPFGLSVPNAAMALGFGALTAYTRGFEVTREGIVTAWRWKEFIPGDDSLRSVVEEKFWQFWFALAGLSAGSALTHTAINRAVRQTGAVWQTALKLPLLVLGGVLGAKLTTSTSGQAAEFLMFAGRMAEFALDGLNADIFKKTREEMPWIQMGVELPWAVEKYKEERLKDTREQKKVEPKIDAVPVQGTGDVLHDLALVQGRVDDYENLGVYRHKLLMVKELGRLRDLEDRIVASAGPSAAPSEIRMTQLRKIVKDKKHIKELTQKLYKVKIGRLFDEVRNDSVKKLESLREEQRLLALQGAPMAQMFKLDREKGRIKSQAKLALGVKLSSYATSSAKWKSVLKDSAVARR